MLYIPAGAHGSKPNSRMLIVDARSYAAAVANRAKGGGCECPGNKDSSLLRFVSPNPFRKGVLCVSNSEVNRQLYNFHNTISLHSFDCIL